MTVAADLHARGNVGVLELAHFAGVAIDDVKVAVFARGDRQMRRRPRLVRQHQRPAGAEIGVCAVQCGNIGWVKKSTTLLKSGAILTMVSAMSFTLS